MPIGTSKQVDAMASGIEQLYLRMRAIQGPLTITHNDVLNAYVRPEHRDILKSAADIAYMSRSDRWIDLMLDAECDGENHVEFALLLVEKDALIPPLSPKYPELQRDAPVHVLAQITSWVTERLEIQRKFGVVEYVFSQLKHKLETARQLRYVFPGALILAQSASDDNKEFGQQWAEKYSEFSMQRHPALDPELRTAIRDASTIITQASLMPKPMDTKYGEVRIRLRSPTHFKAYGDYITRYGYHLEGG